MTSTTASPAAHVSSASTATLAKPEKPAAAASKVAAKSTGKSNKKRAAATPPKASLAKPEASRASSKASAPASAPVPALAKDAKAKKPKLVRDSFTIPKDEYTVIEALKQRCATLAQPVKKSELLRAGLKVLASMDDAALRTAVQAVPSIKTGRPKAETAPTPAAKKTTKAARK